MEINKIVDEFNQLELQNKVKHLTDLQIKADNTDVYSVIADKNFPGLKLYNTDFLIPWDRTEITEYAVFDDHKADYGSGNAPISAFMFRVEEKGKHHYFMTAGRQRGNFKTGLSGRKYQNWFGKLRRMYVAHL